MNINIKKQNKQAIAFLLISIHTFFFPPLTPLLAQNPNTADRFPPAIQHDPFKAALKLDDPIIVQARVKDNRTVNKVLLFYRTAGGKEYNTLKMEWIGNTTYLAIIPRRFVRRPGMEYYIQASDTAGNTATQGMPNTPLIVELKAPAGQIDRNSDINTAILPPGKKGFRLSTASDTESETNLKEKPWYKRWWVWTIAVGVIAGGIAAGGSGSSSPARPNTGTGTVSAGIP